MKLDLTSKEEYLNVASLLNEPRYWIQCCNPDCQKWRAVPVSFAKKELKLPFTCSKNIWAGSLESDCCFQTVPIPRIVKEINPDITCDSNLIKSRGTLVVCALSLVGQWVDEARSRCCLDIYPYHGTGRNRDPALLGAYEIVVTTYQTLASDAFSTRYMTTEEKTENSSGNKKLANQKVNSSSPLHRIQWHRIIVDESHAIKNNTNMSEACIRLKGNRRWCVTGTPFNMSVNDLAGLRFLRVHGFSPKVWGERVGKPYATYIARSKDVAHCNNYSSAAKKTTICKNRQHLPPAPLLMVLRNIFVRHEMAQKVGFSPKQLLTLPPKYESRCMISWDADSEAKYREMEAKAFCKV